SAMRCDLFVQTVGGALHLPDLSATPRGDALDAEPRHATLPFNLFRILWIDESEVLIQPRHVSVVESEARLRHPAGVRQRVLSSGAVLGVVEGPVIRAIEVEARVESKRPVARVGHGEIVARAQKNIAASDDVVFG